MVPHSVVTIYREWANSILCEIGLRIQSLTQLTDPILLHKLFLQLSSPNCRDVKVVSGTAGALSEVLSGLRTANIATAELPSDATRVDIHSLLQLVWTFILHYTIHNTETVKAHKRTLSIGTKLLLQWCSQLLDGACFDYRCSFKDNMEKDILHNIINRVTTLVNNPTDPDACDFHEAVADAEKKLGVSSQLLRSCDTQAEDLAVTIYVALLKRKSELIRSGLVPTQPCYLVGEGHLAVRPTTCAQVSVTEELDPHMIKNAGSTCEVERIEDKLLLEDAGTKVTLLDEAATDEGLGTCTKSTPRSADTTMDDMDMGPLDKAASGSKGVLDGNDDSSCCSDQPTDAGGSADELMALLNVMAQREDSSLAAMHIEAEECEVNLLQALLNRDELILCYHQALEEICRLSDQLNAENMQLKAQHACQHSSSRQVFGGEQGERVMGGSAISSLHDSVFIGNPENMEGEVEQSVKANSDISIPTQSRGFNSPLVYCELADCNTKSSAPIDEKPVEQTFVLLEPCDQVTKQHQDHGDEGFGRPPSETLNFPITSLLRLERLDSQLVNVQDECQALKTENLQLFEQLEAAIAENEDYCHKLELLENELIERDAVGNTLISDIQSQNDRLKSQAQQEISSWKLRCEHLQLLNKELSEQVELLQLKIRDADTAYDETRRRLDKICRLSGNPDLVNVSTEKLQEALDYLERQIDTSRSIDNSQLITKIKDLEEEKQGLENALHLQQLKLETMHGKVFHLSRVVSHDDRNHHDQPALERELLELKQILGLAERQISSMHVTSGERCQQGHFLELVSLIKRQLQAIELLSSGNILSSKSAPLSSMSYQSPRSASHYLLHPEASHPLEAASHHSVQSISDHSSQRLMVAQSPQFSRAASHSSSLRLSNKPLEPYHLDLKLGMPNSVSLLSHEMSSSGGHTPPLSHQLLSDNIRVYDDALRDSVDPVDRKMYGKETNQDAFNCFDAELPSPLKSEAEKFPVLENGPNRNGLQFNGLQLDGPLTAEAARIAASSIAASSIAASSHQPRSLLYRYDAPDRLHLKVEHLVYGRPGDELFPLRPINFTKGGPVVGETLKPISHERRSLPVNNPMRSSLGSSGDTETVLRAERGSAIHAQLDHQSDQHSILNKTLDELEDAIVEVSTTNRKLRETLNESASEGSSLRFSLSPGSLSKTSFHSPTYHGTATPASSVSPLYASPTYPRSNPHLTGTVVYSAQRSVSPSHPSNSRMADKSISGRTVIAHEIVPTPSKLAAPVLHSQCRTSTDLQSPPRSSDIADRLALPDNSNKPDPLLPLHRKNLCPDVSDKYSELETHSAVRWECPPLRLHGQKLNHQSDQTSSRHKSSNSHSTLREHLEELCPDDFSGSYIGYNSNQSKDVHQINAIQRVHSAKYPYSGSMQPPKHFGDEGSELAKYRHSRNTSPSKYLIETDAEHAKRSRELVPNRPAEARLSAFNMQLQTNVHDYDSVLSHDRSQKAYSGVRTHDGVRKAYDAKAESTISPSKTRTSQHVPARSSAAERICNGNSFRPVRNQANNQSYFHSSYQS